TLRIERHIEAICIAGRPAIAGLRRRRALIALIVLLAAFRSFGQPGVTTFGIQVKPVIPLDYFDPLTIVEQEHLTGSIELKGGFLFGMNVRVGITPAISFETGISQIRRAYDFTLVNDTNNYSETGRVRFTGY